MNRCWTLNSQGTAPTIPSSLEVGYVKDTGGATTPGFWWYHMVTETLMNPITSSGLTPSNSDMTQLTQAIALIAKSSVTSGTLKPVRVIDMAGSVTYSGAQTIDSISLINGDRVLRAVGTTASNGIWIVNTGGAWTRATDMAAAALLQEGTVVGVSEGSTANQNSIWAINSVSGEQATIGTTAIGFTNITASTQALLANYLTTATAASTYLTISNASSTYATIASLSSYLTTSSAASTYLTQTNAANTYDTITARNSALSAYLTTSSASSTYATISSLSSYLTTATAASTYATISSLSSYLTISSASSTYATLSYVQGNPQMNSLGVGTAASGSAGEIRATGNITGSFSDDRLKLRERDLSGDEALEILSEFDTFFHRPNEYGRSLGLPDVLDLGMSAQQHKKRVPMLAVPSGVQHSPERAHEDPLLTLRYERDVVLLVAAVNRLNEKLAESDEIIKDLRNNVDRLISSGRSSAAHLHNSRVGGQQP